jgi:small subunit ribosomal protein S2
MKRYIFAERNGIYIIDIQQSLGLIDSAYDFIKDTVTKGGHVLFVGTKKQAHVPIIEQSTRVGMPYVTERWLGGMLTNFPTVYKRIQRLKELEVLETQNDQLLTKKELLVLRREREKLTKNLEGIRNMTKLPSALWVVDTKKEHLAVAEARKLGIPVVAILDTNCDPDEVDYKIPGNDDAIRSIGLLTRVIADAAIAGLAARSATAQAAAAQASADATADNVSHDAPVGLPIADLEKELLGEEAVAEVATAEQAVESIADSAPTEAVSTEAVSTEAESTEAESTEEEKGE